MGKFRDFVLGQGASEQHRKAQAERVRSDRRRKGEFDSRNAGRNISPATEGREQILYDSTELASNTPSTAQTSIHGIYGEQAKERTLNLYGRQARDTSSFQMSSLGGEMENVKTQQLHFSEGESSFTMEMLYKHLQRLKLDIPDIHFDWDISIPPKPDDIEMVLRKMTELYRSVQKAMRSREDVTNKLRQSLQNKENELASERKAMSEHISALTEEKFDLGRRIDRLDERILTMKEDRAHSDGNQEKRFAAQAERMAIQESKSKNEIIRLNKKNENDRDELRRQHKEQLESTTREIKVKLNRATDSLAEAMERHKEQLQRMSDEHDEKKQQLEHELAAEVERMEKDFDRQKINMTSEFQKDLERSYEKLADFEAQRNEEILEQAKIIDGLKFNFETEKTEMKNAHNMERAENAKNMEILKAEHETEKREIKIASKIEQAEAIRVLSSTVESLQIALLKRDQFKAMTDHELADRFQDISNEVDDIARAEWNKVQESTWPFQNHLIRKSDSNQRKTKQYLIQNTLWVILYEKIFCTPFRVLGKEGNFLEIQWTEKYGRDQKASAALALCPRPTKLSEKWRYETITAYMEAANQPLMKADNNFKIRQAYEESLQDTTNEMVKELGRVSSVTAIDEKRVSETVANAARLWLDVGQQRCRMFLELSPNGAKPARSGFMAVDGTQGLVVVPELQSPLDKSPNITIRNKINLRPMPLKKGKNTISLFRRSKGRAPSPSRSTSATSTTSTGFTTFHEYTETSSSSTAPNPRLPAPGDQPTVLPPGYKVTEVDVRDLNELIRKRYELDIEIWSMRSVKATADKFIVLEKMRRSDATLLKIKDTVRQWDSASAWTNPADWKRLQLIRQKVEMDGKADWSKTDPWNM